MCSHEHTHMAGDSTAQFENSLYRLQQQTKTPYLKNQIQCGTLIALYEKADFENKSGVLH